WRPYHDALRAELDRIRAGHGRAVLWEGHSIRGELPFLFEGRLPDMNLGTAGGASCSPALQQRLEAVLAGQDEYDFVVNGRFKGGHIKIGRASCRERVQTAEAAAELTVGNISAWT